MSNIVNHEPSRDILQAVRDESTRKLMRRTVARVCAVTMIVGILNFVLFLAGTFYLGGDAVNGKIENGKYYVWGYSFHDGRKDYHEVSKSVFDYSRWHVYSTIALWTLMLAAGIVYKRMPMED